MLHLVRANLGTATALLTLALILAGCGDESSTREATTPAPPSTASATPMLSNDRAIAEAQRAPMPAPTDPREALPALKLREPRSGQASTAPTAAFELGQNAAGQWLAYRINGDAPDTSVIPERLWDSVPPAAPDLRMRGAARKGSKMIGAHPQEGGWIVSVATQDERAPVIVVTIKRAGERMKVTEVSG